MSVVGAALRGFGRALKRKGKVSPTIKSVKPNETNKDRDVCWVCGGQLIWGGDHDLDKEDNPEYYIVSNLTCSSCESFVEVYHKRPEDESK